MPPKKRGTTKVSTSKKEVLDAKSTKNKKEEGENDQASSEENSDVTPKPVEVEKKTRTKAVRGKKQVKEQTPDELENDQDSSEENGEVTTKRTEKEKKTRARAVKGKKQVKEQTPDESENDQTSNEENGEVSMKPTEKEKKTRTRAVKGKKQVKEETPDKSDDEFSSEEPAEKEKKPRGKSTKQKATKTKKAKESEESSDEVSKKIENTTAKKSNAKKKRVSDDEEEPAKKKAKTEPGQFLNRTESNLEEINFDCDKLSEDKEKYNLKIACWNVSGIRALLKKNGLNYFSKEKPDIIALQELKCEKSKLPNEVKLDGYEFYYLDSTKPGYCGVALYSKVKPIDVKYGIKNSNCNDEGRIITAEYEKYYVVNVYVPNAGKKLITMPKRLEWNEDFKKYMKELDAKKPVIICGDMNVAHQEIDLKNPKTNTKNAGFTKEERDGMTDFLAQGFIDTFRKLYPDKTDAYTFWSYFSNARAKNVGWRLDYFLVSERIAKKVCDNIIRDKVFGSDHCPIVLYITL